MLDDADNPVHTAYCGEAAASYDAMRFVTKQGRLFSILEFEQLERALARIPADAHVLELGCGTARFSEYIADHGYSVLATDPSADMIKVASEKCRHLSNIAFSQEEGTSLKSADSAFDFVFAIRVTNQTESAEYALEMIKEMIRVTKPGGLILVEFANAERPFSRKSKSVRLSFDLITKVASEHNCTVESRSGVLVYSQTILVKVPRSLVPLWGVIERVSARLLWRWASRGYILLRKKQMTAEVQ